MPDPIERFVKENPEIAMDLAKRRGGCLGKLLVWGITRCMKGDSNFSIAFRKGFEKWQKT